VESLKTKAAKAAEIALKMKKENDNIIENSSPKRPPEMKPQTDGTISSSNTIELERKFKDQEKKMIKLRNDKYYHYC
jgi:hypothetical protein